MQFPCAGFWDPTPVGTREGFSPAKQGQAGGARGCQETIGTPQNPPPVGATGQAEPSQPSQGVTGTPAGFWPWWWQASAGGSSPLVTDLCGISPSLRRATLRVKDAL